MQLSFQVSRVAGVPSFDSLPVAKVTHYPLEKRDYKPYAQCIFFVGEDDLTLRMWAFEVSPLPASNLRGVFYLFEDDPQKALCIDIYATGHVQVSLLKDGSQQPGAELEKHSFAAKELGGEDLQGVYWGNTVTIPLKAIRELGGEVPLEPGTHFPGNFYKLCKQAPFVHSGSCFPADFAGNPYTKESMGTMQVVSY